MATYNLPELTDTLTTAEERGGWLTIESLDVLASNLKIDRQATRLEAIESIPDAWAHIQLFGQALIAPLTHEAHEAVRGQWRGLLALLALQPLYKEEYALSVTAFELEFTPDEIPAGNRLFRTTMKKLKPAATLAPDAVWTRSGLVLFHSRRADGGSEPGVPVAFLSPISLIAASRNAAAAASTQVSWLTATGIVDPLLCAGVSSDAFAALARYIGRLIQHVESQATEPRFKKAQNELVEQLKVFANACKKRAGGALELRPVQLPVSWPQPFFEPLGGTFEVDDAKISTGASDCRVRLRPLDGAAGLVIQSMVLVDQELARTLNLDAAAIRVWERFTLADAARPETLTAIRKDAAKKGHLVVTSDELLTRRLVRLSDGSTVRGHNGSTARVLLPLTPLALLLGDARSLAEAVSLTEIGGAHEFTLGLVIEADRDLHHALRRTYSAIATSDFRGPDDLAIWPDFERPGWPWNFLRFQYATKGELQVRFAASAAMVAADVRESSRGTAAAKAQTLEEWSAASLRVDRRLRAGPVSQANGVVEIQSSAPQPILRRFEFARLPELVGEQHHLPLGAEAIFFAAGDGGAAEAVGCALVIRKPAGGNDLTATISIDFGSTNTITYARVGDAVRQLSFGERLHRPVQLPDETGRIAVQSASYIDFFPPAAHGSPFPTILKVREFQGSAGSFDNTAPGADMVGTRHMIFFNPIQSGNATGPIVEWMRKGFLVSDIKWSKAEGTRYQTARFLRQTMIMSAAELVAHGIRPENIAWRLSYPQSFDRPMTAQFKEAVGEALVGVAAAAQMPTYKTEGEAAAHYFMQDKTSEGTGRLLVILDVGGSTTDMAFRFDGKLVWRGSARIAGRAFFTNYLTANPALLGSVDPAIATTLREKFDDAMSPGRLVELLLGSREFTTHFDNKHKFAAGEPVWAGLRHSVTVAIGGLLYYLGLTLRGLVERGEVAGLDEAALRDPVVAFGGRGSHSLRRFQTEDRLDDILKMLPYGARLDSATSKPSARFSPLERAKHEVAHGLLEDRKDGDGQPSSYLPLGEALEFRKALNSTLDPFTDVLALPGREAALVGFEPAGLLHFLDGLKKLTGVSVRLDGGSRGAAGGLAVVRTRTERLLREQADGDTGGTAGETQEFVPPFLLALGSLVDLLSDNEKVRAETLAVNG